MAVQKALFLRELYMRLTTSRMGLFWTFFEPFYQVAFFVTIKIFIFGRESDNFDYVVFVTIAIVPFILFKNIIHTSLGAFTANKNLFVYKQVKPIDTILARVLLEVFISSMVMTVLIIIAFYFNFDTNPENLALVSFVYIWIVFFAFSLGIFLAVLNSYTNVVAHIVKMSLMGLILLSAIFYTVNMLIPEIRVYILYNPLTHFIELIHAAYFYTVDDTYVNYTYMILWTIIPLNLGLWFYVKLEKKIIST
jgi:capsular polysaccharide transport system permease protein